ncbi:hypothetical protein [Microbispora sp. H10836]|nr:hypothetical protein [Microbispora sp. H10836]
MSVLVAVVCLFSLVAILSANHRIHFAAEPSTTSPAVLPAGESAS